MTALPHKFEEVNTLHFKVNRKFKIYFEMDKVQNAFYKLLEPRCSICEDGKVFDQFTQLKRHFSKEHNLYPCDLCVEHVQVWAISLSFIHRVHEITSHKITKFIMSLNTVVHFHCKHSQYYVYLLFRYSPMKGNSMIGKL